MELKSGMLISLSLREESVTITDPNMGDSITIGLESLREFYHALENIFRTADAMKSIGHADAMKSIGHADSL